MENVAQPFAPLPAQVPIVLWSTDNELAITSISGGLVAASYTGASRPRTLFELFETTDRTFPPIAYHLRALKGEHVNYEYEFKARIYNVHLVP
jgi:hypothetical protein